MDVVCGRCLGDGFPQSPGGGRGPEHFERGEGRRRREGRGDGRGLVEVGEGIEGESSLKMSMRLESSREELRGVERSGQ